MSDHILEWLGAYMDGELHGRQLTKVEVHLAECETCQAELASLKSLSGILHEMPALELPVDRFASNVNLRLARRPKTPIRRKVLEVGWWMIPVGLLLAWVFVNTSILVGNLVSVAGETGLLDGHATWLTSRMSEADWSATLGQFGLLSGDSLRMAGAAEIFSRTVIPEVTWQVAIALLYLCWIAIWWSRRMREERGQLLDGGIPPTVK